MKQNEIPNAALSDRLDSQQLENLFNVYQTEDGFYFYNIAKTVVVPPYIAQTTYDLYTTLPQDTYPLIAFKFYNDVRLWWIVCAANQIDDPTTQPQAGTVLKMILKENVSQILSRLEVS